jgi:hypothetical protein
MNPDGSVALLNYREDGVTRERNPLLIYHSTQMTCASVAYFTFWRDGVTEVKL